MYVIKRCPSCKAVYEHGHDYRSIGVPYKTCSNCQSYIIDQSSNEWELMPIETRLWFIFICIWSVILYAISVPLIYLIICKAGDFSLKDEVGFVLWALVVAFGFISIRRNLRAIKESRVRMKDTKYRVTLMILNLLPESEKVYLSKN
jgi:hypothetical protein